jgi:hypothetical protein
MQEMSIPVRVFARTYDPAGPEAFEFFPVAAFYWVEPQDGGPVGQNSHGQIKMPPRPAPDALVNVIIPFYRGDRQNLRLVGVQPVQNLWQLFGDPRPQNAECLFARVEYEEGGRTVEEEFYGIYDWNQTPSGIFVQTNWGFGRLFACRAERGQLDALRQTFMQIPASLRFNPQWGQLRDQILQQLRGGFDAQVQNFYATLEAQKQMSRQITAHNDHLIAQRNAQVNASLEQQRQLNEQRSQYNYTPQDAWGDAMMGRTAYHDPNSAAGNYHYEHGHPAYTYTDGQGGWYSTDDPLDNPNTHRNGNWTLTDPLKPGR